MTVEHVHVHSGAQAVVGLVNAQDPLLHNVWSGPHF
jgi:hypothetical protein